MFIKGKGIYLTIVPKIQLQPTMWATSTDRTRIILIQTLATLNGDNIQTSHGAIIINMLQNHIGHLDFTNKIKGKETPAMTNLVFLKL